MEDFGGKSPFVHLSGAVMEKGDKKNHTLTFPYHLFFAGQSCAGIYIFTAGCRAYVFPVAGRFLFLDSQQFNFEYQCRERFDLCTCLS